jgi:hypothetical protein
MCLDTLFCSWCFCTCDFTSAGVESQEKYATVFREIGKRLRQLRKDRGLSQEDMLSFGFSTRHWQQVEAGRPVTLTTILRACDVFGITPEKLLEGAFRPKAAK